MRKRLVIALSFTVVLFAADFAPAQWTQWGGPTRDFKSDSTGLADTWPPSGPGKLWERDLGEGYSAILVDGGVLFTMFHKGDHDYVVALDESTGETKWQRDYEEKPVGKEYKFGFGKGPNSTPLVAGDRLFTTSFSAKLNCFDKKSGKTVWSHDLMREYGAKLQEFGYSASPIVWNDSIIVLVGGKDAGVMAFRQKDGSEAWRSEGVDISYASPILIKLDGQDQLVFMTSLDVAGLDPTDGRMLWKHKHANQYKNNCHMPIWGDDHVLLVSSHADGGGRALKLSRKNGKTEVKELWANRKLNFFHSSAFRIGDCAYGSVGSESASFYVAVDALTGKELWRERGYPQANSLLADGKVILLDEDGKLTLAKVSEKKFTKLSQTQLCEKVAWTVPTLVGTKLYVRDKKHIMAIELGKS